jgi:hypothetical protein
VPAFCSKFHIVPAFCSTCHPSLFFGTSESLTANHGHRILNLKAGTALKALKTGQNKSTKQLGVGSLVISIEHIPIRLTHHRPACVWTLTVFADLKQYFSAVSDESPKFFLWSIFKVESYLKSEDGGHPETIKSADRVRGMIFDCPTGLTCLKCKYENFICHTINSHGLPKRIDLATYSTEVQGNHQVEIANDFCGFTSIFL